ncbi:hypothetical protein SprV_0702332000 [Sparganum proliferum]
MDYTKHGRSSEIIIKAQKTENRVDNFICKINGVTSHSQTIYWKGDSDSCSLNEGEVEQFSDNPHLTEENDDARPLENEEIADNTTDGLHQVGNSTKRHCNWRLIRWKRVMTEYHGPCAKMMNMTGN